MKRTTLEMVLHFIKGNNTLLNNTQLDTIKKTLLSI